MDSRRGRGLAIAAAALGVGIAAFAGSILSRYLGIHVEIVPDRRVWEVGETVTGTVVVRNRGLGTVTFPEGSRVSPWIFDTHSQPVRMVNWLRCDAIETTSMVHLRPGDTYSFRFELRTEVLGRLPAFVIRPGAYSLQPMDPVGPFPRPVRVVTAPIEFVPPRAFTPGARIVDFAAAGERIAILREDGRLESFRLPGGEWLGGTRIEEDLLDDNPWALSPDATRFAVQAGPNDVAVYQVSGTEWRRTLIPGVDFSALVAIFDGSGRFMRAHAPGKGLIEIDLVDGASRVLSADFRGRSEPTPDGRFFANRHLAPLLTPVAGGPPVRLAPPGDPGDCSRFFGRRGIYFANQKLGQGLFRSYDGKESRGFAIDCERVLAESPDLRLVACGSADQLGPPSLLKMLKGLEVLDLETGQRLCRLDDGVPRGRVVFASTPLRLVCALVRQNAAGAAWCAEDFELRDPASGELIRTIRLGSGQPPGDS